MRLFGRKGGAAPNHRDSAQGGNGNPDAVAYRFTLDLMRAEQLAGMMAKSRSSRVVEVADLLAGMYISDWDRLSEFWDERNQEEIEDFLRGICQISPQRWHAWIQFYDGERKKERDWKNRLPLLRSLGKKELSEPPLEQSAALAAVLHQAGQITPFYERSTGRSIPILTSECVLLSIARSYGTEISRKLAATGLNAAKLEKRALSPKRAPLI